MTISIKQPWASLIAHGIKDIENRTWPCTKKYIGQRVLIHASKTKAKSLFFELTDEQIKAVHEHFKGNVPLLIEPKGSIIGSVEIVDCVINYTSIWAEKTPVYKCNFCGREITNLSSKKHFCSCCGKLLVKGTHYQSPIYNWVLANPILFKEPIPAKGKLSFWNYYGINEVKIECPECGSIEVAVENYTTAPFPTFLHSCTKCGYVIMESEWNVID